MTQFEDRCPTCTRSKYDPFRRYDPQGKIIYGCVDDFHTGHLTPISESNSWHFSKQAVAWRRASAKHLKLVLGRKIHDYKVCECFKTLRGH